MWKRDSNGAPPSAAQCAKWACPPAPVLAKLNAAIVKVLAQPDVKKKINEQGAEVYSETPEQFAAFIQAESVKWGKVVKESGASLD